MHCYGKCLLTITVKRACTFKCFSCLKILGQFLIGRRSGGNMKNPGQTEMHFTYNPFGLFCIAFVGNSAEDYDRFPICGGKTWKLEANAVFLPLQYASCRSGLRSQPGSLRRRENCRKEVWGVCTRTSAHGYRTSPV